MRAVLAGVWPVADEKEMYTKEEYAAMVGERDALKANRDAALDEAKRAKKALQGYDGLDPEEFKQLKAAAEEAERKKAAADGDFKALEKQLIDNHAKEIKVRDESIVKLKSALEKRLVDAEATRVLSEAKGSAKVLLPHVKQQVKVVEQENGEYEVVVVDGKGNPRIADGKGTPMTLAGLVEEMKADPEFAKSFDGTGSSGGGAPRSNAGGGGPRTIASTNDSSFLANLENVVKGTTVIAQ